MVGGYHNCGLKNNGSLVCWGYNGAGQAIPPSDLGPVFQGSAGTFNTCVILEGGAVRCWGLNDTGQSTVPSGLAPVAQVSASWHYACALRTDGTVVCWGTSDLQSQVPADLNSVSQIATGITHTCALKTNHAVVCWGYDDYGQSTVPGDLGPVAQVSAGDRLTCVLQSDGTVRCWGYNQYGQATVPSDLSSVSQISAGHYHVCALKTDGTVVCWGDNEWGERIVPDGLASVTQVGGGAFHTCALKSDGSVVCWGGDSVHGQSFVPAGLDLTLDQQTITFTSVPPSPAVVGATYNVAASGGASGNNVTFSIPTTTSVCSVSGTVVTLLAVGDCTIAADQAGNDLYLAAPRATQTFSVAGSQTIQFTSVAPSPGVSGTTYTVSATGGASGNPVTFSSLSETICTVAGSTVSLIHAGTCIVAGDQAAGNGYLAASQASQSFSVVDPQPQGINFTSTPPDPALVGGSYLVSATGGGSGNPVTFSSLTPTVCFVSGNNVSLIRIGTCHVAADQSGNTFFLPAPQATQVFDINDVQAIAFTSTPPAPGVTGTTYSVTATGGLSGNPVTFSSLSTSVCTVAGGTATLTGAGTCIIAADQAAGSGYLAAPRKTQSFTVIEPIPQNIAFTSTPPSSPIIGDTYSVTANGGGSGNPVLFSSLTPSVCFVLGNTVSLNARGTCRVAADQTGNTFYLPAAEAIQVFDVYDVQSITFTSTGPAPGFVGDDYTITAVGGLSGNPVTFSSLSATVCSVSGNTATLSSAGTCIIAADQVAGGGYIAAPRKTQSFTVVEPTPQIISFTSTPPTPGVTNTSYVVGATGGLSGNPVTFSSLSTDVCTVSGSTATLSHAGTCIVAADQAAAHGYRAASQVTQSFSVVDPLPQEINFTSSPPAPALVGGSYNVSASGGGSGNPVLFSSLTPSVCFVLGSSVSLNARGTCRVAADQGGNTFYLPALQTTQVFDINDVQAITFTSAPPAPGVTGGTYSVTATGGLSGNPVTFSSLSSGVCTVSGNTASFNAAGTCVIAADQAGGSGYLAAPQKTQSVNVIVPIAQTIHFTSTPPNPPIVGGAYTVSASGGGSGNPVTFSSLTPGTCGVSGAMVSFVGRGGCTIAANQAGSVTYLPADQITQSFVIDTRPVANAGATQNGNEGAQVTFNASGSSDADGDALINYRWDFGDGTVQNTSSPTVQHVYNDNGTYTVTLLVTDAPGATSLAATTSAVIANIRPTATFAPTSPTPEGTVTLSLSSVQDAAGDLPTLQYSFDCGDGAGYRAYGSSTSFACSPVDNGVRTVRARVRDKDGGMNEYTASVTVVNVAPTITLVSAPTSGTVNVDYTVQFSFSDPGTTDSPWSYQVTWGDGTKTALTSTSTQGAVISQTHRYSFGTTYTVSISVKDKDGGTSTTTLKVTIGRASISPGG